VCIVSGPVHYRRKAAVCVRRAQHAHDSTSRVKLFELAEVWIRFAEHVERRLEVPPSVKELLKAAGKSGR